MGVTTATRAADRPVDLGGVAFARDPYAQYRWLLESAPVSRGRISLLRVTLVARYEDCRRVLTDPVFVRSRARARGRPGASPLPFPLPPSVAALARSMIYEDDPEHLRLRSLVNRAFTARAVARLSQDIERLAHGLLDRLEERGEFDLLEAYARPIPTRVIAALLGVSADRLEGLERGLRVLTKGLSGWSLLRTLLFDLRATGRFVRQLIRQKRAAPGDDVLSALIAAEEEGERLSEDELVAMVFLLIVAGFETTLHQIANGARLLIEHPDQLARLRREPALWEPAVEEMVRHRGPVHGTKPQYPRERVEIGGVAIERGTPVMPLLGAANHDPRVFAEPDRFDVGRTPNPHLGFGFGAHYCLGRPLALLETRIALASLFERMPALRLAVPDSELRIVPVPGWYRLERLPVVVR